MGIALHANVSFNILIPNSDIKVRGATPSSSTENSRTRPDFFWLVPKDNIKLCIFFKMAVGFTET